MNHLLPLLLAHFALQPMLTVLNAPRLLNAHFVIKGIRGPFAIFAQ